MSKAQKCNVERDKFKRMNWMKLNNYTWAYDEKIYNQI